MMKHEFQDLAIRKNGGDISFDLYTNFIEYLYTAENRYHDTHGGNYETKQEFVKRVYGGKINTSKTILAKTIQELQRENTYSLDGCNVDKTELDRMNRLIAQHVSFYA